jgi:outer membrane biosynthesis protein TonB
VAQSLHPLLDGAALEAARRTTFYPALRGNRPIGVWVAYPVRFRLED